MTLYRKLIDCVQKQATALRDRWLSGLAILLFLGSSARTPGQEFQITQVTADGQGRPVIKHKADPAFYYILYRGTNIQSINTPVNLALGSGSLNAVGSLIDVSPKYAASYYRALRVSTNAPLDIDADGIDDVWELRFRWPDAALNPSDSDQDQNGSGTPDLVDFYESVPLVAWFTNAETAALSYGGLVHVGIRFSKPVTGVYTYEVSGTAGAGKDFQSLTGTFSINNSLTTTIPVEILDRGSLTGPRSLVLTLKTPATNVVSRIPAAPSDGYPDWRRFSSHVVTIRDADQGLYSGNMNFLSETTTTVENGQTKVAITPSPSLAPSGFRMGLRSTPHPHAIIEMQDSILFTKRFSVPIVLQGDFNGFVSAGSANGETILPYLKDRRIDWQFGFDQVTFTSLGALLEAECSILLNGLTASGVPRLLKGTISASRLDP